MRVHLRNIVNGAISRGLTDGYVENKQALISAKTEEDELHLLSNIGQLIWEELDEVIDFSDEEEDTEKIQKNPMGFSGKEPMILADAVSVTSVEDDEDDETIEGSLQRSVRYHKKLAKLLRSRPRRS